MSIHDDLMSECFLPAAMEIQGDEITRYPGGDTGAGVPVTGVWIPEEPQRQERGGERINTSGKLTLASSETVKYGDSFLIGSLVWQVDEIGEDEGGMRQVKLTRAKKMMTKEPGALR